MSKIVLTISIILLLSTAMCVGFVRPVVADGTIYIRANGSIEGTTHISSADNITYTFTDNIYDEIVVERDNIVVDGAGYILQGDGSGTGINVTERSNVAIKNTEIKSFDDGILLEDSSNNSIYGSNITENKDNGIYLKRSSNNSIHGNNIGNNYAGITIPLTIPWSPSSNNIIAGNNITENTQNGIHFNGCFNNTISGNNITANRSGIFLWYCSNISISANNIANTDRGIGFADSSSNIIYHNNFMGNIGQVSSLDSTNVWDDGYPSGGNYWSDYNGTDAYYGDIQNATGLPPDGIGDTPYTIDANNTDRYPLMGMFSDFNATSEHNVQTICNSTISEFQYNGTAICFNVTGENGTTGFCRICIPTGLMNYTYEVLVNGTEVPYTLLSCSNSTHSYLYFTYEHSTQEIEIVPEFHTWTSTLLVLVLLAVAIAIYKRRQLKMPAKEPLKQWIAERLLR